MVNADLCRSSSLRERDPTGTVYVAPMCDISQTVLIIDFSRDENLTSRTASHKKTKYARGKATAKPRMPDAAASLSRERLQTLSRSWSGEACGRHSEVSKPVVGFQAISIGRILCPSLQQKKKARMRGGSWHILISPNCSVV